MTRHNVPEVERFLMKVSQARTGCWLWTGGKAEGYGVFGAKGKSHRAHRYCYELFKGPIPAGMLLRHTCDTPSCVNPDHLIPGTATENTADMVSRGRARKASVRDKLADYDERLIALIGSVCLRGEFSVAQLALMYSVSKKTVARMRDDFKKSL